MRNLIPALLLFLFASGVKSQQLSPKATRYKNLTKGRESYDDAHSRQLWELKRLADPETGKIPSRFREKELAFSACLPALGKNLKSLNTLNWQHRGPWNVGGITRALAMDVNDENTILAGTNSGGVWRSTDGGISWNIITPKNAYHGITTIAQDKRPGHTQTWYFGSGDPYCSASGRGAFYSGNGVYKSTDNGLTWNKLTSTAPNTPHSFDSNWDVIYRVITDPHDTVNDVVYAATYGAVYKSSNGGNTWSIVKGNGQSFYTHVDITSTGVVYCTLGSDGGGKGIWRSADGINFTNITPPNFAATYDRIVSGIVPSNENVVYFLGNTPGFGVPDTNFLGNVEWNSLWRYTYLSGDGDSAGGQWEDLSASLPTTGGTFDKFHCQGSYDLVIKIKPDDPNTVIIGGTNLYRSTNAFNDASTNNHIGGYKKGTELPVVLEYENHHPDQHELIFFPSNPNKILSGCDGGVFRSDNVYADTMEWTPLNNGYITSMFYTIAMEHTQAGNNIVIGGLQDNGTWFTNNDTLTSPWVHPRGGDGSYCAIADNFSSYYFSIQNGKMMKANCDNNGNILNFARIDPRDGKGYQFINPYTLDPNNNNIMYLAGGKYLWKNTDLSGIPMINNWDSITTNWVQWPDSVPTANVEITAVAASKQPANVVYYGTSSRKVYRIDNAHSGTPAPVDVTSTSGFNLFPTNGYVSCIAIDPADANKAIVVFSNYSVYSVYYTENAGQRWRKVSGNLESTTGGGGSGPSVRWATIIHPPQGGTAYLLGTSTGLYGTSLIDSINTVWTNLSPDDIGNVVVDMMDYRPVDGKLIVGTHARGVYSTTILNANEIPQGIEHGLQNPLEISVFPNPANETCEIQYYLEEGSVVEIQVCDESGRMVSALLNEQQLLERQICKFDVRKFPSGVYYVQIKVNNKVTARPLVIRH